MDHAQRKGVDISQVEMGNDTMLRPHYLPIREYVKEVWKMLSDDKEDKASYLSRYNNSTVYSSSFHISQNDMFKSVLRNTGDKEKNWTITHADTVGRVNRGRETLKGGNPRGFGIILYTRSFYKDGSGSFNDKLDNEVLGLPKEKLDEATKVGVGMALAGDTNVIR